MPSDDVIPMPFRRDPGDTPYENTLRLFHQRPEVLEHTAGNLWNATSDDDRRFGTGWRDVFAALPEDERATWRQAVLDRMAATEAMTPEDRKAASATAWRETLAHNDERYRRLTASTEERPTNPTTTEPE